MSNKTACKQCPFREDSTYGYDADAAAALEDGDTPACHMKVGTQAIFLRAPMDPVEGTECVGHDLWLDGTPGYAAPKCIGGVTE